MPAGESALTEAAAASGASVNTTLVVVESDTPAIETAAYQRSVPRWRKNRDIVFGGTEAIRAGGVLYLPQHPNEGDARYNKRRVIAALFNGLKRTVQAAVGMILEDEPEFDTDMPQKLIDLAENVDGIGTALHVFAGKLTTHGIVDGFAGILTEYPRADDPRIDRSRASLAATEALKTGQPLDAADEAALGLRPYFILVKADTVLLPLYQAVNGQRTLVMLILREVVTERKGRFGLRDVKRYRVYELRGTEVFYERWTETDGTARQDEKSTLMRNVTEIPWSPMVCGEELGPNEYRPTLDDVADLILEHHQIKTGILSLQDLAYVPTPVRIGCPPDNDGRYPELVLGPSNTIEVPATIGIPNPVYWLSPSTDVLEPGMKSLENTKAEIGAMGAAFLAPQPVQETATANRQDSSAEHASIRTVSRTLKDCLERAFGHAGQYMKLKGGSIKLKEDFVAEGVDTAYVAQCVAAYLDNVITLVELRTVMKTGKLPETFDPAATDDLEKELQRRALALRGKNGTQGDNTGGDLGDAA